VSIRPKWRALESKWHALTPKSRALTAFGLLAAGGVLIGLGVIAGSAEDPSGEPAASEASTQVGAAARDKGDLQSPAKHEGDNHEGDDTASTTIPVDGQRLRIPSLGINAPVLPISAEGSSLVPPSDPQIVGWWSDGARPGADRGTAILTGHTVSTGGGVFDDLEHMRPGQHVQIRSNGQRLSLEVNSVTTYHKTRLAERSAEVFDQTAPGRVALVTCEDWNGDVYRSNVVVMATPTG
jgi:LPXTG-site transpeptidase (sortase) family protein